MLWVTCGPPLRSLSRSLGENPLRSQPCVDNKRHDTYILFSLSHIIVPSCYPSLKLFRVCSWNFVLKKFSRCNVHQSLDIEGFKVVKEAARKGFRITKLSKFVVLCNLPWASSKRMQARCISWLLPKSRLSEIFSLERTFIGLDLQNLTWARFSCLSKHSSSQTCRIRVFNWKTSKIKS